MTCSARKRRRVWIIDPLDGTAEFIAHNGEFVIMIGLAVMASRWQAWCYQPIDDLLFAASKGMGGFVEV